MDIYAIWVQSDGEIWLYEAWDGATAQDENPQGYQEVLQKAYEAYGIHGVRAQRLTIPYENVKSLFEIPTYDLKGN